MDFSLLVPNPIQTPLTQEHIPMLRDEDHGLWGEDLDADLVKLIEEEYVIPFTEEINFT